MGFYFRKSINFGSGFRVNLSKSGIGYSYGVKGFRISTGPRGTYATVGGNGFYYRERIDNQRHRNQNKPSNIQDTEFSPELNDVQTADVSQLVDSSSEQILSEINRRKSKTRMVPIVLALWGILAFILLYSQAILLFSLVSGIGIGLTLIAHRADYQKRTTALTYELKGELADRFSTVNQACDLLSRSNRIWRVESQQGTWDWKRNAGATSLINRSDVGVGRFKPSFIETNLDIRGIDAGALKFYFFPDLLLVYQGDQYGAVSYESLSVECSPTRFIEDGNLPRDAQIVDHTWKYVNKSGGPDRRFSNNRQLPVVQYAHLEIKSTTGLNIHLQASNIPFAQQFAALLRGSHARAPQEQSSRQSKQSRPGPSIPTPAKKSAYDVLGISRSATFDDVTAAYHKLARMNHPDRVADLAPEFKELAERRMKEINAAYESLKKEFRAN